MKVLSLTQPWATLVAIGAKCIETRSWSTEYRGSLAIHASKRFPTECRDLALTEPFRSVLVVGGIQYMPDFPLGRIIATCELLSCVSIGEPKGVICGAHALLMGQTFEPLIEQEMAFGDYGPGRFAWVLGDIKKLDSPIVARGMLGLWETDLV